MFRSPAPVCVRVLFFKRMSPERGKKNPPLIVNDVQVSQTNHQLKRGDSAGGATNIFL